jgi:Fic family protein
MSEEQDRHSKALDVELIADPIARAEAEAKNGIRQFDAVVELIDYFLSPDRKVRLRPSHLLHLHRIALEGISSYAGNYRPAGIEIHGSRHQPVGAHLVPGEVEEMCDYINEAQDQERGGHDGSRGVCPATEASPHPGGVWQF